MLKNGQVAQTVFTGYSSDGMGVCRIDGCAVFVPNAIAGEECLVRIVKVGKNAAWGKIEQILVESPHRLPRACPQAKLCGGCQFQHMDYAEELSAKAQRVSDALARIGKFSFLDITVLPSAEITGYRNKAQFPVGTVDSKPAAGFYKERTHQIIPVEHCLILPEEANLAKDCVLVWMNRFHILAYEEQSHTGLIRHVYVRKAFATGQILVCVVANGERLPHFDVLLTLLQEKLPSLTSVVLSIHKAPGNAVLGNRFVTLFGSGTIEDELCGLRFQLSPRSFYQINRAQAERLYALAVAAAELTGKETVLDLYCGIGTITLALAGKAGKAIGVELVEQAIEDARENARRNKIMNAEFFCADAAQAAAGFLEKGISPDVIVVDPPRKGLAPEVIGSMVEMAPKRIVYVSCDPATLARDVRLLADKGYAPQSVQCVDLFPRCAHVETVVKLVLQAQAAPMNIASAAEHTQ